MVKELNPICEVCGVKIDKGKYCFSHRRVMNERNRTIRFLDSEAYQKLPIRFRFEVIKKA